MAVIFFRQRVLWACIIAWIRPWMQDQLHDKWCCWIEVFKNLRLINDDTSSTGACKLTHISSDETEQCNSDAWWNSFLVEITIETLKSQFEYSRNSKILFWYKESLDRCPRDFALPGPQMCQQARRAPTGADWSLEKWTNLSAAERKLEILNESLKVIEIRKEGFTRLHEISNQIELDFLEINHFIKFTNLSWSNGVRRWPSSWNLHYEQ